MNGTTGDHEMTGESAGRKVMDFTSPANLLGPSGKAKQAMRKALKHVSLFPEYDPVRLIRYIAALEKVGQNNVVTGHGTSHLIELSVKMTGVRRVAVVSPVSVHRARLFREMDLSVRPVDCVSGMDGPLDLAQLVSAAKDVDGVLVSRPHDVTGRRTSLDDLASLVREIEGAGKMVFIDESFIEFTDLPPAAGIVAASRSALLFRSFSTFHGLAGLRAGYAIGPEDLVAKLRASNRSMPLNNVAVSGALASLKDKGYRKRTREALGDEKRYLLQKLATMGALEARDTPCNFILLFVGKDWPSVQEDLRKQGILVDLYSDEGENVFIRLPMGRRRENARFVRIMERLQRRSAHA